MRVLIIFLGILFTMNITSCRSRVVVSNPNVKVITVAPKNHKVVYLKGKRYYFWNGNYHKKTRKGYVIVRL